MLKKTMALAAALAVGLSFTPALASGQDNPFQIAFIGPTMQLVDDDANVKGIRLNLPYGVNENVWGLDAGFINHTRGEGKNWQLGLVGLVEGSFTGYQSNFINLSPGDFLGLQTGFVNHAGTGEGVQLSPLVNHAYNFEGFQMSLVNFAEDMYGLQIGLINIIRSKEDFPILPLVNWKFE